MTDIVGQNGTYTVSDGRRRFAGLALLSTDGDAKALLHATCCNGVTGYVRETFRGAAVPKHALEAVVASLAQSGWTRMA
jgi:hypothetical protein